MAAPSCWCAQAAGPASCPGLAARLLRCLKRWPAGQANGQWRLAGAESYLESVSPACTYADLCWRLGEKHGAASIRYVLPGEKLDPDSLITVADDQDVQARQPRPRGASASDCRPFGGALRAPRLLAAPAGRASPAPAARTGVVRGVLPRAQGAGHAGQDVPAARGAVPGCGGADDARGAGGRAALL